MLDDSGVQSEYFFTGTTGPGCTYSGTYSALGRIRPGNSSDVGPRSPANPDSLFPQRGNFTMVYQGNDCPN